jgi:uncharacterized protein YrzB (UPF0473 family)
VAEFHPEDSEILTFVDENGQEYEARVLAEFEFENKKYALLREEPLPATVDAESEQQYIIMRVLIEDKAGDSTIYRSLDDEAEFKRVQTYIYNALLDFESRKHVGEDKPKRMH